jgi:N-acetylglutamate synthase-like GNAT family acetyltransferase
MLKKPLKNKLSLLPAVDSVEINSGVQIVLIEQDQEVIGFSVVKLFKSSEWGEEQLAELSLIYIEPDYQDKSLRKTIYNATFKALYRQGFHEVFCSPSLSKQLRKYGYRHYSTSVLAAFK